MSKNILFILTSHGQLGDSDQPTGFHYEEMTTPYFAFKDAGFDVLIASIAGGQPPHDPSSLKENPEDNPASVRRFTSDPLLMNALKHSRSVYELPNEELEKFAAVYLPGGHGTMWDLPNCERLTEIIEQFYKAGFQYIIRVSFLAALGSSVFGKLINPGSKFSFDIRVGLKYLPGGKPF